LIAVSISFDVVAAVRSACVAIVGHDSSELHRTARREPTYWMYARVPATSTWTWRIARPPTVRPAAPRAASTRRAPSVQTRRLPSGSMACTLRPQRRALFERRLRPVHTQPLTNCDSTQDRPRPDDLQFRRSRLAQPQEW